MHMYICSCEVDIHLSTAACGPGDEIELVLVGTRNKTHLLRWLKALAEVGTQ